MAESMQTLRSNNNDGRVTGYAFKGTMAQRMQYINVLAGALNGMIPIDVAVRRRPQNLEAMAGLSLQLAALLERADRTTPEYRFAIEQLEGIHFYLSREWHRDHPALTHYAYLEYDWGYLGVERLP